MSTEVVGIMGFEAEASVHANPEDPDNLLAGDNDPTNEGCTANQPVMSVIAGRASSALAEPLIAVFGESMRDLTKTATDPCYRPTVALEEYRAGTMAHDVLHTLSLEHDGDGSGGIM